MYRNEMLIKRLNKTLRIIPAIIVLSLLSCQNHTPQIVFPGEQWKERTPESQDVDAKKLRVALDYLESKSLRDKIDQVAIIRNGYLIHAGEHVDSTHNIWSCSKTFTSTVLGLLVDDGVTALDDIAADHEPLLKDNYAQVTFRHFATMTSGYNAVGDSRWPAADYADWSRTPYVPDTPYFERGTAYAYWDEAQMMFGRVLTRILNQSMYDFLSERVMKPIGITDWEWYPEEDINGIPINNGCTNVFINAKQLARWGWLFLNRGKWEDRRLISESWVDLATNVQVPPDIPVADTDRKETKGSGSYGFNWWVNGFQPDGTRKMPDAPAKTYWARGLNSNFCMVVPEWNMVIVRMGEDGHAPDVYDVWNDFFKRLQKAVR
jgi:CubicO group peptidase (beta-lactamase class C family)